MADPNHLKSDGCPEWAAILIGQIRDLEVRLGNIPDSPEWHGTELEEISRRIDLAREEEGFIPEEEFVEAIFRKVVQKLHGDGFDKPQICKFINSRVTWRDAALPYCDVKEIDEALTSSLN